MAKTRLFFICSTLFPTKEYENFTVKNYVIPVLTEYFVLNYRLQQSDSLSVPEKSVDTTNTTKHDHPMGQIT